MVVVATHTAKYERDRQGCLLLALDGSLNHLALCQSLLAVLLWRKTDFRINISQVLQLLRQYLYALCYSHRCLEQCAREGEFIQILVQVLASLVHL